MVETERENMQRSMSDLVEYEDQQKRCRGIDGGVLCNLRSE